MNDGETQIKLDIHAEFEVGDQILVSGPENRWWRIWLYKIIRRSPPMIRRTYQIKEIAGDTWTLKNSNWRNKTT